MRRTLSSVVILVSCAHGLNASPRLKDILFSRRGAAAFVGAQLSTFTALSGVTAIRDAQRITAAAATDGTNVRFRRVPKILGTEFIAALGDPDANSGVGAEKWGLWSDDPGPQGVLLRDFESKLARTGVAPAGWAFDASEWWLEEYGRIMPGTRPLPAKKYVVTANREVVTVLTVHEDGRWALAEGTLADVTHLPCRAARYTPTAVVGDKCSPARADRSQFRVRPGALMPQVPGCTKQDYRVLFVLGYSV